MTEKKKLLIVGASFSGLAALRNLYTKFQITIVDSKDFFEYTPAILDCYVDPEKLRRITIPMHILTQKYKFEFVHGIFISIQNDSAVIQCKDEQISVNFNYCLLCTGSLQNKPIKSNPSQLTTLDQRQFQMEAMFNQIKSVSKILIVGGGTVGTELAAILAETKKVTLSARGKILSTMPNRAQRLARERLRELGVDLQENTLQKDLSNDFDLVFECTGNNFQEIVIQTQEHRTQGDLKNDQAQSQNKRKGNNQLNVDDFLRVMQDNQDPYQHIFAAGDVALSSLKEAKTALGAELYGEAAAHNLKQLAKPRHGVLKKIFYIPKTYSIPLSGRNSILVFEQIAIGGFIGWASKVFIEKTKMIQCRGNYAMDLFWDLMHIVLYAMTAIYMFCDAMMCCLPQNRSMREQQIIELKEIRNELIQKPGYIKLQ